MVDFYIEVLTTLRGSYVFDLVYIGGYRQGIICFKIGFMEVSFLMKRRVSFEFLKLRLSFIQVLFINLMDLILRKFIFYIWV